MGVFRDYFSKTFETFIKAPIETVYTVLSDYLEAKHYTFWITWMQRCNAVYALEKVYLLSQGWKKDDQSLKGVYEIKKEELTAEGAITKADIALGVVGTGIAKGVKHIVVEARKNLTPVFEDFMEETKLSEQSRESIRKIAGSGEFGLNAVVGFMLGHFLSPAVSTSLSPMWRLAEQQTNKAIRSSLLSPIDLIRAGWRGELTEDQILEDLQKQGYADGDIEALRNISLFYPSPADLVTWQAREVYEPDMIEKYGLEEELENVTKEPFYKSGMTDEQIRNFWIAHWQHPPWTVIRSMLFRTDLEEKDVWDWFKTIEIPPYWRDKYIEIAYNPVTRVDLRRLYRSGIYDREAVKEGYIALGNNPAIAEHLTAWTEEEYAPKEKDLTKTEVLKNYRIGEISLDTTKTLLEALDYSTDQIAFLITYEDYSIEAKAKEEEAELLLVEYVNGSISFDAFQDSIEGAGFTQKTLTKYLDKATRKTRALTKLPSKEDVTKWLKLDIINEEQFISMLSSLKYRSEDIARYLEVEKKEK